MKTFKPRYQFTTRYGAHAVVHDGQARPDQWQEYISADSGAGAEIIRLSSRLSDLRTKVRLFADEIDTHVDDGPAYAQALREILK